MISYSDGGTGGGFRLGGPLQRMVQHWVTGATLGPPSGVPMAAIEELPGGQHGSELVFRAGMEPSPTDVIRPPSEREFVDGLWKRNVVECFLGNPVTGRYLEIHLAPTHQWWACLFRGERQREQPAGPPLPLSQVRQSTARGNTYWEGEVRVPVVVLQSLLEVHSLRDLRGNLTAVWYPPGGHACYFSLARLPGDRPDFHQPGHWLPLSGNV
jgi:hypothetical protein